MLNIKLRICKDKIQKLVNYLQVKTFNFGKIIQ